MIFGEWIAKARRRTAGMLLRRRMRSAVGSGTAIIASNCVGSRLSNLGMRPYNSPTVGLWLWPEDFLRFAADLGRYLASDVVDDPDESRVHGYPVGILGGDVRLYFQHYESFDAATTAWRRRAARVALDDVVLIFTDQDGCTADHLRRFEALPYPKLAFTARPHGPSSVVVPADRNESEVRDLYTHWEELAPVLTASRIRSLFGTAATDRSNRAR